jgi:origin recognition complex subunit 4
VPAVMTSLLLPVSTLRQIAMPGSSLLPPEHFEGYASILAPPPSSLELMVSGLSEVQLAMLIAAARLDVIHDSDACSFGMAYAEYVDIASKARQASAAAGALASVAGAKVWGKEVAKGAWEALTELGLLVPINDTGAGGRTSSTAATLGGLVRIEVKLEEIPVAVPSLSTTMERWCRQI